MKIRLVHTQEEKGAILITDIDEGVDREFLDTERKQNCYVTYNKKSFTKSGTGVLSVVTDLAVPGFTELVESDKVMLSRAHGDIAGLAAKELLTVVEIPTGALNAPEITGVTGDGVTLTAGDTVTIAGDRFTSFAPDVTSASITDGTTTLTFTEGDADVTFTDTTITILAAANTFTTLVTEASVTANGQTATS